MGKDVDKIIFKCEECGHIQEKDEEQSTENWDVFPVKCQKCGGKLKMTFDKIK